MAAIEFRHVSKVFGEATRALDDLSLTIADGEFLVLVGPSGCGKSTALRLVAGLETVTAGEILADGNSLNALTPQERNVAIVFQNYALYPHKTVRQNLEFPLRMMKLGRAERRRKVEEAAGLLGLERLLDRRPKALSGGQQQRVAMGRAIVREPIAFLMDEPLSNLDAKLRVEIRAQIAALQKRVGTTTLYVTHDQVEAMTLGDRVGVMRDGRLQQVARAEEVYKWPANVFVATFIGSPRMNIVRTRVEKTEGGTLALRSGQQRWRVPVEAGLDGVLATCETQEILVGLRPEAFRRAANDRCDEALTLKVQAIEALGHECLVYGSCGLDVLSDVALAQVGCEADPPTDADGSESAPLGVRLPGADGVKAGQEIRLRVDLQKSHLFDREGTALRSAT